MQRHDASSGLFWNLAAWEVFREKLIQEQTGFCLRRQLAFSGNCVDFVDNRLVSC